MINFVVRPVFGQYMNDRAEVAAAVRTDSRHEPCAPRTSAVGRPAPCQLATERWTGSSVGTRARSARVSGRIPHQCSGRAAMTSGRPSRSVASASRASLVAASSRRRGEASGSTVVLRSSPTRAASDSGRRGRPGSSRGARQARPRNRDTDRPPPRYPPRLSPPAATWLGCTRRRRADAPPRSEWRGNGSHHLAAPQLIGSSSDPRRRTSGHRPSWTPATTTRSHSSPLARWAVSTRTADPRSSDSRNGSAGIC